MKKIALHRTRQLLIMLSILMMVIPILRIIIPSTSTYFSIQENTSILPPPRSFVKGIYTHELQNYLEQQLLQRLSSLRAFLILTFNQLMHSLFKNETIQNTYIWTPQFGFYPLLNINNLNFDMLHSAEIETLYQRDAHRLLILQKLLQHYGVTLLVVPTPTKARLYPEYIANYLLTPPSLIIHKTVSYGEVLEKSGVNVVNIPKIFAERKATSPWPFFTTTSFHWSFWAGCEATQELLKKAATLSNYPFFDVNCSNVSYEKSKWQDRDIVNVLNLLSVKPLLGYAPFPIIAPQNNKLNKDYSIAIIGDSFSGHLIYALTHAIPERSWRPGWLVFYNYFKTRDVPRIDGEHNENPLDSNSVLAEILHKKLLVIEISDGNIPRDQSSLDSMEFGASKFILDKLLPQITDGPINLKNFLTSGWHSDKNNIWHTTHQFASAILRTSIQTKLSMLTLDIRSLSKTSQNLNLSINNRLIKKITLAPGRQKLSLQIEQFSASPNDSLLSELTLSDVQNKPLNLIIYNAKISGTGHKNIILPDVTSSLPPIGEQPLKTKNLIYDSTNPNINISNLNNLENDGKEFWRWATGPETKINFYLNPINSVSVRHVWLTLGFKKSMFANQTMTIRLNGKDIYFISAKDINQQLLTTCHISLKAQAGVNILEFIYSHWNHRLGDTNSDDPRQLAMQFTYLALDEPNNINKRLHHVV